MSDSSNFCHICKKTKNCRYYGFKICEILSSGEKAPIFSFGTPVTISEGLKYNVSMSSDGVLLCLPCRIRIHIERIIYNFLKIAFLSEICFLIFAYNEEIYNFLPGISFIATMAFCVSAGFLIKILWTTLKDLIYQENFFQGVARDIKSSEVLKKYPNRIVHFEGHISTEKGEISVFTDDEYRKSEIY